jgi:LysM repeat protein
MLGLIVNPVVTAPLSAKQAAECGTVYIVKSHDNLSKIAEYCGTTLANILYKNPQITNPNLIYPGQEISLSGVMPVPTTTPSSIAPNTNYRGAARVSVSTTQAREGGEVTVSISGFPANSTVDYRVGQQNYSYSRVYDGNVASNGKDIITITLPPAADYGEYWVIVVVTTSQRDIIEVISPAIYITG